MSSRLSAITVVGAIALINKDVSNFPRRKVKSTRQKMCVQSSYVGKKTMIDGRGVLDIPLDLFSGERYVQCLDILV